MEYVSITSYFYNLQDAEPICSAFNKIDWTDGDAIEQLNAALTTIELFPGRVFEYCGETRASINDDVLEVYIEANDIFDDFDAFLKSLARAGSKIIYIHRYDVDNNLNQYSGYIDGKKKAASTVQKEICKIDKNAALSDAINRRKVADVEECLTGGANPNAEVAVPPLVLASALGNKKVVELLVNAGANPNSHDKDGSTPLYYAIRNDNGAVVKYLLENGAEPNLMTRKGNLPIHSAVGDNKKYMDRVKLLLKHGADIKAKDGEGRSILMAACAVGLDKPAKLLQYLIKQGAEIHTLDNKGRNLMFYASNAGSNSKEACVLELGFDYVIPETEYNGEPDHDLITAINFNDRKKVKALLKTGIDPNLEYQKYEAGNTYFPLYSAAQQMRVEIVKMLLEAGADSNKTLLNGQPALQTAAFVGCLPAAQMLIAHGADVNHIPSTSAGWVGVGTALHWAVRRPDNQEMIKLLVEHGADPAIITGKKAAYDDALEEGYSADDPVIQRIKYP